uniref:ARAD1A11330p n=1 Tax=Blastobotrys adeninivorans TaxID=409370 RepID=A0A060SX81_BLAAD
MPQKDENLDMLGAGEATNFWDPQNPPLFVSPSNSAPSEKLVPYLSLLFPNVPERAKHNNVLLKHEELDSIEEHLNYREYCSDYDVTIVIDEGAGIEDQVRANLENIGRKARVNCAFSCCILTIVNRSHAKAAVGLARLILKHLGRWWDIVGDWWNTTTNHIPDPVSDFYTHFTHVEPSLEILLACQSNEADASFIERYSEPLCEALGMSTVPSLAIESANSDDIRKLFHDCINWLAGTYLRVNTVVGVNNSPDTYSVDILNFDSTVDNLLHLADNLSAKRYPVTKEALYQSAKMKTSVIILQLRLLQYLLNNRQILRRPTQKDIDDMNRHLAGDVDRAQRLCPDLGIKRLDLKRFPFSFNPLVFDGFTVEIENEIRHYQRILNRPEIDHLPVQLGSREAREAIVRATYAIVHYTEPETLGPISGQFEVSQDLKIELPKRALYTLMGDGKITFDHRDLSGYIQPLAPNVPIMLAPLHRRSIPLEWIADISGLSEYRNILQDQLAPANYNPRTTLGGEIEFDFIYDAEIRQIARKIKVPHEDDINLLVWNILKAKRQRRVEKPLVRNQRHSYRSMHVVRRELGPPEKWVGLHDKLSDLDVNE